MAISSEYNAGASCPFDEKYTSASSLSPFGSRSVSVHSHVMMSVELKLEPMWPEPACMIMNSVLMRQRSASSPARAIGSLMPPRTARNTSRDTNDNESSPTNARSEKSFSPINQPINLRSKSEIRNLRSEIYLAVQPPSTTSVAPVMYEDAGEARNNTAPL